MDQRNKVDRYFLRCANDYGLKSELGLWRAWKENEFKSLLSLLPTLQGQSVLEVGCGKGWYTKRLINFKPRLYVAVDRLHPMINPVNKVLMVVGDLTKLPFKCSFDYILCFGALEFIKNPNCFFQQAKQLLNTKGRIIVQVPTNNFFGQLYKIYHAFHGLNIHLFSDKTLQKLSLNNGLVATAKQITMFFGKIVIFEKENE